MKAHRVYAMILRYWYILKHSLNRQTDMFYWPLIDLLLWGLTSKFLQENAPDVSNIVLLIISGLVFWIIIWRGYFEITINLLEEIWNKNLVNIFVSPLKLREWISAIFIFGIIRMVVSFTFASIVAYLLYATNILAYGFYLVPFALLLILTAWAAGLFVAGIILRFGSKYETLAWTGIMIISPFSAVYYPLAILPGWAQTVAKFVPPSYVFENGRKLIANGKVNPQDLVICFGLNLVYFALALVFIKRSFARAKDKGLISVY